MKFTNFLRTIILMNICERLFLNIIEKETRTQVLSCEFCKLFKNTNFLEDLQTACSDTPVMLERDSHRYFSVNFDKCLGKLFCRTPPSNYFSHDVVFFIFADQ